MPGGGGFLPFLCSFQRILDLLIFETCHWAEKSWQTITQGTVVWSIKNTKKTYFSKLIDLFFFKFSKAKMQKNREFSHQLAQEYVEFWSTKKPKKQPTNTQNMVNRLWKFSIFFKNFAVFAKFENLGIQSVGGEKSKIFKNLSTFVYCLLRISWPKGNTHFSKLIDLFFFKFSRAKMQKNREFSQIYRSGSTVCCVIVVPPCWRIFYWTKNCFHPTIRFGDWEHKKNTFLTFRSWP